MRCAASGAQNPRKLSERTETRHTEPHSAIIAHTMPNSRPNRAVIFCASVNLHICERVTAARAKAQKLHQMQLSDNSRQYYCAIGRKCNFHKIFIIQTIQKQARKWYHGDVQNRPLDAVNAPTRRFKAVKVYLYRIKHIAP